MLKLRIELSEMQQPHILWRLW